MLVKRKLICGVIKKKQLKLCILKIKKNEEDRWFLDNFLYFFLFKEG